MNHNDCSDSDDNTDDYSDDSYSIDNTEDEEEINKLISQYKVINVTDKNISTVASIPNQPKKLLLSQFQEEEKYKTVAPKSSINKQLNNEIIINQRKKSNIISNSVSSSTNSLCKKDFVYDSSNYRDISYFREKQQKQSIPISKPKPAAKQTNQQLNNKLQQNKKQVHVTKVVNGGRVVSKTIVKKTITPHYSLQGISIIYILLLISIFNYNIFSFIYL